MYTAFQKFYGVLCVVSFISLIGNLQSAEPKTAPKESARYLFFQQLNDMCTIAPMLNRAKLLELKKIEKTNQYNNIYEQSLNNPSLALTRRQWFGEGYKYLFSWRKFLVNFMNTTEGKAYFAKAAQDGLVAPYFYDQKGKNLFEKDPLAFAIYPYFFANPYAKEIETSDMGPGFYLPIVNEQSIKGNFTEETIKQAGWKIYNSKTKQYVPFSGNELNDETTFPCIKEAILPRQDQSSNQLIFDSPKYAKGFGFASLITPHWSWQEPFVMEVKIVDEKEKIKNPNYTYTIQNIYLMPYCLGFLKLMFLALGINNNNKPFDEKDSEYQVHKKMKTLIEADKENNPWSSTFFKKEFFIQYVLADIFEKKPALYQRAAKTVDILGKGFWQTYENIITGKLIIYRNAKGTTYNTQEIKHYLPGPQQALAYFFTEAVRCLWYGATSKKAVAYYSVLGAYDRNSYIKSLASWAATWWKGLAFSYITSNAEKTRDGISFISVWKEIRQALKNYAPDILDWVSFDSHGWVISFDPELIHLQRNAAQEQSCDYKLLDKLGVAGIESWKGDLLEVFYKK